MTLHDIQPNLAMFIRPLRVVSSGWSGHVPFGSWLMAILKPRVFVELGSHFGMSYAAFCQTVQEQGVSAKCYAIDTWKGDDHAGFYGDDVYNDLLAFNERHFAGFSRLMRMTFDEGAAYFENTSVDLLHIDGLHTYEAVKHDFETWLPKLSDRAIVLFHDTNVRERGFGVWKYWEELSRLYPHFEFDHAAGLGVLAVGKQIPSEVKRLIDLDTRSSVNKMVKDVFSSLGESVLRRWELDRASQELKSKASDVERVLSHLKNVSGELERLQEEHRRVALLLQEAEQHVLQGNGLAGQLLRENLLLKDRLAHLENTFAQAEQSRRQIADSLSYRVTKPLRLARGLFNR